MSIEDIPRHLIVPEDNYYYTKTHEWVSLDDKNSITIGISYYAQDGLGEIVSWKLPQKGQYFEKGQSFGWIESNKSASDIYMPVSGEVVEINSSLSPSLISDKPMEEGWLVRVEIAKESELSNLLSPAAYRQLLEAEAKKLD